MKKLVMALALFGAFALIQAQTGEDDYYAAENNEHSSDGTATEIISAEPIAIVEITGSTDPAVNEASGSTPDMDMTASVEAGYTEYQTKINIPLWYRWRDFSFNASIPYFIIKKMPLPGEVLETNGLGDVSVGASYGKYLEQYKTYLSVNATVKLPTGDDENTVKDQNDWEVPVPLGSGSTDIAAGLSGFYFMDSFTFKGNVLYKMNGEYDKSYDTAVWDPVNLIWVPTTLTVTNDIGDLFIISAGADYRWQYRLTFGMSVIYGNRTASETEGTSNEDGISYIDLDPTVKYSISLFEFVLGARIPVSTTLESDDFGMNDGNRTATITFRTNYRIF